MVLLVVCKSWLLLCVFKLARAFYGALNFHYAGTIIVSILNSGLKSTLKLRELFIQIQVKKVKKSSEGPAFSQ